MEHFRDVASVSVEQVSVPYYVGGLKGIDFAATARHNANLASHHLSVNCAAMARAKSLIGKPDLVISDYEPISAQYAYAHGAPLVTIDQQSKYLVGDFPPVLNGVGYEDEVQLLRMFFPKADARLACTFFRMPEKESAGKERVTLYAPILKQSILNMRRRPTGNSITVYISAQREFAQSLAEIAHVCSEQKKWFFHIFAPAVETDVGGSCASGNLAVYKHGDPRFPGLLAECSGIVSTAGHSLLSEAMYLGIPVYATPLAVYEQQMNAHIMDRHGFGVSHPRIAARKLAQFLRNIPDFERAIQEDKQVLLRGSSESKVISFLEKRLLRG
jgi:uncharacterized protein (TIGR00661 family)